MSEQELEWPSQDETKLQAKATEAREAFLKFCAEFLEGAKEP